jgi:cell fate regulator YaaT (PSP1 superfamily)
VRHLGLRDAARVTGGIGPCGLQLCCNTFLAEFAPVSIRMAKDQGLALNPQRVSGVCGRLLCCLVYEDAFYRQQRARYPKPGKRVQTPRGEGSVRDVDVLASTVRVALRDGALEAFALDDVTPLEPAAPAPAPPRRDRPR